MLVLWANRRVDAPAHAWGSKWGDRSWFEVLIALTKTGNVGWRRGAVEVMGCGEGGRGERHTDSVALGGWDGVVCEYEK